MQEGQLIEKRKLPTVQLSMSKTNVAFTVKAYIFLYLFVENFFNALRTAFV